jgi:hypothetical protein
MVPGDYVRLVDDPDDAVARIVVRRISVQGEPDVFETRSWEPPWTGDSWPDFFEEEDLELADPPAGQIPNAGTRRSRRRPAQRPEIPRYTLEIVEQLARTYPGVRPASFLEFSGALRRHHEHLPLGPDAVVEMLREDGLAAWPMHGRIYVLLEDGPVLVDLEGDPKAPPGIDRVTVVRLPIHVAPGLTENPVPAPPTVPSMWPSYVERTFPVGAPVLFQGTRKGPYELLGFGAEDENAHPGTQLLEERIFHEFGGEVPDHWADEMSFVTIDPGTRGEVIAHVHGAAASWGAPRAQGGGERLLGILVRIYPPIPGTSPAKLVELFEEWREIGMGNELVVEVSVDDVMRNDGARFATSVREMMLRPLTDTWGPGARPRSRLTANALRLRIGATQAGALDVYVFDPAHDPEWRQAMRVEGQTLHVTDPEAARALLVDALNSADDDAQRVAAAGDSEAAKLARADRDALQSLVVRIQAGIHRNPTDPGEMRRGMRHEREHTPDPVVAAAIACDHLEEIPDYYTRLAELERRYRAGLPAR